MRLLVPVLVLGLMPGLTSAAQTTPTPVVVSTLGDGWSGSSINVVANRRHALFSHDEFQFAAYYDASGRMVLARRSRGANTWELTLTDHTGQVADAHNSISLGVDGDGYLHVAWDHHGHTLNYARSRAPGSLELGAPQRMTGVAEASVTYPEFHLLPDGDLLCLYRDGGSGRGRLVLNRYDRQTRQWTTVHDNLIDGEGQRSPYWGATIDRDGQLHLTWIWRATPDVATNQDLAYARSPDGGRTWLAADGRSLEAPFTAENSAYALRIPPRHHLMNSPWITTDSRGRPYITTYWSPSPLAPPQFHVLWHSAGIWQVEPVTARTDAFSLAGTATKRPPISRAVLVVVDAGPAAHLVYRDDAHGGGAVLMSTPRVGSGAWSARDLPTGPLGAWEPTMDPTAWSEAAQLELLLQAVEQRDGDDTSGAPAPPTPVQVMTILPAAR